MKCTESLYPDVCMICSETGRDSELFVQSWIDSTCRKCLWAVILG